MIRSIKQQLRTVKVGKVIQRLGYTNRSSFYFHLNEARCEQANLEILSRIVDAIHAEQKQKKAIEEKLKSKLKLSA